MPSGASITDTPAGDSRVPATLSVTAFNLISGSRFMLRTARLDGSCGGIRYGYWGRIIFIGA
jgi:hypothetical protein